MPYEIDALLLGGKGPGHLACFTGGKALQIWRNVAGGKTLQIWLAGITVAAKHCKFAALSLVSKSSANFVHCHWCQTGGKTQ